MLSGQRWIEAEFLADDLREIRFLLPSDVSEGEGLVRLLHEAIVTYRNDEAVWQDVEHQHDAASQAMQAEMKRRETSALLVSMRSRTIQSEMEMYELRERVRALQERHTEQRAKANVLQRSIAGFRRRIAAVEDRLAQDSPIQAAGRLPATTLRQTLAKLWRRHG